MMKVIKTAAIAALTMSLQVGCATSSYKHFEHSDSEVTTAMLETEEATLARLKGSPSLDIAQAARQIALEHQAH